MRNATHRQQLWRQNRLIKIPNDIWTGAAKCFKHQQRRNNIPLIYAIETKNRLYLHRAEQSQITHNISKRDWLFQFPLVCRMYASMKWVIRLVACSAPSHYLKQCWLIVNLTPGTYFSDTWIRILSFSLKEMQLKMSSAKMAATLPKGDELTVVKWQ